MPDPGLLLQLAEIAGIFVGFGALISVRSADSSDPFVVSTIRYVTWVGVWVLISSLTPAALSRFGLAGRTLWLPSAVLALVLFVVLWLTDTFSPESKSFGKMGSRPLLRLRALYLGVGGPLVLGLIGSLVVVALDIWPEAAQGLYFAAVSLGMALAGLTLLTVVFIASHR